MTPATAQLQVGQLQQFTADALDAAGATVTGQQLVWTVSDTAAAAVVGGMVTAKAPGTVRVSATANGVSGSADITITQDPVATVTLTPANDTIYIGRSITLIATTTDGSGVPLDNQPLTWATSDSLVAAVSATGIVTARATGTATITATSDGHVGTAVMTVETVPVASVDVAPATVGLLPGQTQHVTATPRDASGVALIGRVVTWQSADSTIAQVSAAGDIVARAVGTVTVTATSEGRTGTVQVIVTNVPVAAIYVAPASATILVGQTTRLAATATDSAGGTLVNRPIGWQSSDNTVVTVTSAGVITGMAPGKATITATSESRSASAVVTVQAVPAASVTINPPTVSVAAGQSQQLTATVHDSIGGVLTGRTVTWASSDGTVATVDGTGLVQTIRAGSVTITATSENRVGSATVTVTAPADNVAPSISALTITPGTVDVTSGAQTISATAHITDAGAGVTQFRLSLTAPDVSKTIFCVVSAPTSGDHADGTWTCNLSLAQNSLPGNWTVGINAVDGAGNILTLDATALAALSAPTSIQVVSQHPDTTPPTLDSLKISPVSVDVSTGSQTVTATFYARDDESGVQSVALTLSAPSGGGQLSCSAQTPVSGTAMAGVWTCTVTIPQSAMAGDWAIRVNLLDQLGNNAASNPADLTALGLPTSVTVTGM